MTSSRCIFESQKTYSFPWMQHSKMFKERYVIKNIGKK